MSVQQCCCCRCCLQHIEKVLQHKDLESQLSEAKLSQATIQLAEEKERNLQEKQQVLNCRTHIHRLNSYFAGITKLAKLQILSTHSITYYPLL